MHFAPWYRREGDVRLSELATADIQESILSVRTPWRERLREKEKPYRFYYQ